MRQDEDNHATPTMHGAVDLRFSHLRPFGVLYGQKTETVRQKGGKC